MPTPHLASAYNTYHTIPVSVSYLTPPSDLNNPPHFYVLILHSSNLFLPINYYCNL